jgi:hypothetical protein
MDYIWLKSSASFCHMRSRRFLLWTSPEDEQPIILGINCFQTYDISLVCVGSWRVQKRIYICAVDDLRDMERYAVPPRSRARANCSKPTSLEIVNEDDQHHSCTGKLNHHKGIHHPEILTSIHIPYPSTLRHNSQTTLSLDIRHLHHILLQRTTQTHNWCDLGF